MNIELEITDIFEKDLLRAKPPRISLAALPNVGDAVWIESKRWEVGKRCFYYHEDGTLYKVSLHGRESDF